MTTTERSEFKAYVLGKDEQQKISTNMLSRETSPHTNEAITAAPPSRETGPHTNQMLNQTLKKFTKIPERCEECGKEHPTCVCIDRFRRLKGLKRPSKQRPKTTIDMSDDESSGSDTLHESEDEDETTQPKSVTFDLPPKDDERDTLSEALKALNADESESDDGNDDDDAETQQSTSQNDEVDAQLAHAAWLRKVSDNVYMSNRKSMVLRAYIHAARRRTEVVALLDSGATKNFMNVTYAKWLKLPFKRLAMERPLFNVNGSANKAGSLKYYTDLEVQTGTKRMNMRFFLADLGEHKVILGYPWFAANQPKIDWARV